MQGILTRFLREMGAKPTVVATGGLSQLMAPLTGAFDIVDPWLTLEGIRLIGERNT